MNDGGHSVIVITKGDTPTQALFYYLQNVEFCPYMYIYKQHEGEVCYPEFIRTFNLMFFRKKCRNSFLKVITIVYELITSISKREFVDE